MITLKTIQMIGSKSFLMINFKQLITTYSYKFVTNMKIKLKNDV